MCTFLRFPRPSSVWAAGKELPFAKIPFHLFPTYLNKGVKGAQGAPCISQLQQTLHDLTRRYEIPIDTVQGGDPGHTLIDPFDLPGHLPPV